MPSLLSRTGAFSDTRRLVPDKSLLPYDLIVAFWSDGAEKSRWIALPKRKIRFSDSGAWQFPAGTVLIKHFELPIDASKPGASGVWKRVYSWSASMGPFMASLTSGAATKAMRNC
jgi:hypothetical protein